MLIAKKTALVYCENQFGLIDGKTAAGLVRYSESYNIVGIIDSSLAGKDAGEELDNKKNHIPIFANLDSALDNLPDIPHCYIYGKAPLDATLSIAERALILEAMTKGMDIINGLHEFFSEDSEFIEMAANWDVEIRDIRKPPQLKDLHLFTGEIAKVNVPVIAILGTDCACGKMTTAVELNKALNKLRIKSVLVATGQTAIMQGAKYGVSIDALVSQFVIGEIEHAVVRAFELESPDIILVEGQSSVSHPAFMSSVGILKGCMPDGIILQHPPGRRFRCDFPHLPMPNIVSEIQLIKAVSQSQVIAIALNHENMTEMEVQKTIKSYEDRLLLPTTDVLTYGCSKLIRALGNLFPNLERQNKRNSKIIPLFTTG